MNRQQKEVVVQLLKDKMHSSSASFLVGVKGLSVAQIEQFRTELRAQGGALKIAKARLMKLAAEGLDGIQDLTPHFKDQVGLVFASDEFTSVAKVLADFADKNKALQLMVGCLESDQVIDKSGILRISSLPSKQVLLGQVCAALNAPLSGLAVALNMTVLKLVWALKKVAEKQQ